MEDMYTIDYRELLKKYMEGVYHAEGMTYLKSPWIGANESEKEELETIEAEIMGGLADAIFGDEATLVRKDQINE